MTLSCKAGSFAKKADGTGTQAVTGVGFTPKVLIFFWDGSTSYNTWGSQDITAGIGVAESDNSSNFAVATASEDKASGSSNAAAGKQNTKCVKIIDPNATTLAEAATTVYGADGFTLDWTTNDANATIIHYLALGGDEITNSNVVSDIFLAAGDHAVTGVGFTPDTLINIYNSRINTTETGNYAHGGLGIGFANGSNDVGAQVFHIDNDGSKRNKGYHSNVWSFMGVETVIASSEAEGVWKSFDADGFTYDILDAAPSPGYRHFTLCLKGVTTSIGTYNAPNSISETSETGVGFTPVGLLWVSNLGFTDAAGAHISNFLLGTADGTNQTSSSHQIDTGATLPQVYSSNASIFVSDDYQVLTPDTTKTEGQLTSFDADGFTVNWITADTWQSRIHYIAFDEVTSTPAYVPGEGDGCDAHSQDMEYDSLIPRFEVQGLDVAQHPFQFYTYSPEAFQNPENGTSIQPETAKIDINALSGHLVDPDPPAQHVSLQSFQSWSVEEEVASTESAYDTILYSVPMFFPEQFQYKSTTWTPLPIPPTPGEGEILDAYGMGIDNTPLHAHWEEEGLHPSLAPFQPYSDEPRAADVAPYTPAMQSMAMGWNARLDPEPHLAPFQPWFNDPITESTVEDEMPWYRPLDHEFRPDPPPMDVSQMPFQAYFDIPRGEFIRADKWYTPFSQPIFEPDLDRWHALMTTPFQTRRLDPEVPTVLMSSWYVGLDQPADEREEYTWILNVEFQEFEEASVEPVLKIPDPPARTDDSFERRRRTDDGYERRGRTDDDFYRPRRGSDWTDRR